MAEYICTISAKEYRDLVECKVHLEIATREHRRLESELGLTKKDLRVTTEELAEAREQLEEMAKDLAKSKESYMYWYNECNKVKAKLDELEGKQKITTDEINI